mgnify:CR=1 FL=1
MLSLKQNRRTHKLASLSDDTATLAKPAKIELGRAILVMARITKPVNVVSQEGVQVRFTTMPFGPKPIQLDMERVHELRGQGWTLAEVGVEMGVSEHTIFRRLHHVKN